MLVVFASSCRFSLAGIKSKENVGASGKKGIENVLVHARVCMGCMGCPSGEVGGKFAC